MFVARRALLSGGVSVVALAGCGQNPPSPPTLGTIAGDASLVVIGLQRIIRGIEAADPTLIKTSDQAKINVALTTALVLVNGISAATPAGSGASTVQIIDNCVNTVLDIVAALPVIPPPYTLAVQAAAALAPVLGAFVNSTLHLAAAAPPGPRASLPAGMTAEQARAQLHAFVGP